MPFFYENLDIKNVRTHNSLWTMLLVYIPQNTINIANWPRNIQLVYYLALNRTFILSMMHYHSKNSYFFTLKTK